MMMPLLVRLPDWPERLTALVAVHQAATFEWGAYDCATLWLAAIEAVTGHDMRRDLRPWYSEASAARALVASGHRTVADLVASRLPEIAPAAAMRGDLAFPADPARLMGPAVVTGADMHSRSESGWVILPRTLAVRAFAVGAR